MKHSIIGLFILGLTMVTSCGNTEDDYVFYPKPISSQKIIFPEKAYEKYVSDCDYSFEIPVYSEFVKDTTVVNCNGNIVLKNFNATMYLTHLKVDTNLMYNIEYSRKLAYDHSIKADEGIDEAVVINPENNVYGLQYKIKGNAASNYQFYLTDSTENFLRGALYFNAAPNYDSLKPTLDFIMDDFDHLIKTVTWE
jgi:gliding motility-associated lipoprotein GldD